MLPNRLKKLVSFMREQGIKSYKGTWAKEQVEIHLSEQPQEEKEEDSSFSFIPERTAEERIRDYEADLF